MIYQRVTDLIGRTPLVAFDRLAQRYQVKANILAKLECMNPAGSAKDRAAYVMILDAERSGRLAPGGTIIEPTSGNTGIGLASVAVARGYQVIMTMPETMSLERRRLIAAYGAQIVLTPGQKGMQGAVEHAQLLQQQTPNSILIGQFENPANPQAHYQTTGPEIWQDTQGKVDVLVAGVGTGGTISGTGRYLKEQNPQIEIIAVEPADSPLLSQGKAGPHKIQGIGANFIPKALNQQIYQSVSTVQTQDAITITKEIARTEGILVGISSGAAMSAAIALAKQPQYQGKNIVVILPDTGERYLSTGIFDE